ncbi:2,3-bisphosphoglycerate-independent phosphoglycerate mutase [Natronohydrobacter thiooxidans]|uniref:2,3-bisphosphoglycerate-independent phosphoglycerate mutase n=1 Tax=Natronohydrobacter thiooxidans TaxID=87172 RepID=UPI0008FF228B|nr:2,3-bisphosphoglycerate-independent phosphoglycerate mutase [Natronohydrobacter thiooxidans]
MTSPVVLCILDGWGLSPAREGNAVAQAATPNFDRVMRDCPNATLITHGPDAGLPSGQMGNSEVGHTNIGAGRVVAMDLGQIDLAIEDGSFATTPAIQSFVEKLQATKGTAHVFSVVSDGGVHGHVEHLKATIAALGARNIPVVIHAITDGRDVAPKCADQFLRDLGSHLSERIRIGTVIGRYWAMDRDNRWDRIERAYSAIIRAEGARAASGAEAVAAAYARNESDEFIAPTVINGYTGAKPGDGFFCLNFRADRAREILAALGAPSFNGFDRGQPPAWSALLGMVEYSDAHNAFMATVFPKRAIANTLGAWVAQQGLRQFRLAETEKYPHVTFFLNGGKEDPEPGEDRHMPQSPKVATYDLAPEMAAAEVGAKLVEVINARYDLIVVNFANPDMVGHTGDLAAACRANEAVDAQLGAALEALKGQGGAMLLTADHGNCETMIDPDTGGAHTAHTLNPVPVVLIGGPEGARLRDGRLADIAPTVLALMGLEPPPEMTGQSLIER